MARYVIDPAAAIHLAKTNAVIADGHQLLAPAVLRSQVLSILYEATGAGDLTKQEADAHLSYIRGLRMRLLGDRVLHSLAWKLADELGLSHTIGAEYLALTQLHGDGLITLDNELIRAAQGRVTLAPIEAIVQ